MDETQNKQAAPPAVLHIVYNLIRGGTEGQCARVAMGLRGRGQAHRVAAFRRDGYFLDKVEEVCGPVYHFDIQHLVSADTLREIGRLKAFIRGEGFGVVHAWDADAAIFGAFAVAGTGVRFITSRRDLGQIYPWYKLALMRRADRKAETVVVNAEAIRSALVASGLDAGKCCCLPNLLDLEEFDILSGEDGPQAADWKDQRVVIMVARLDPEKDTAVLIDAAARLAKRRDDLLVAIVGDGPERAALERQAADRGLGTHVEFLGEVNDVPALLRHAEIGVLVPNANEGLSNTILEYMAAGLPVVATDCGGNSELVRDGETGCLVPVGDVAAVAEAIDVLLDDPEDARKMGRRGRHFVETRHAPGIVLDQFENLYRPDL